MLNPHDCFSQRLGFSEVLVILSRERERDFSRRVLLVRFVESNDLSKQLQTKGGTPTVLPEDRVFQVLAGKVGEPDSWTSGFSWSWRLRSKSRGVFRCIQCIYIYIAFICIYNVYMYIYTYISVLFRYIQIQPQIHIKGYFETLLAPKVSVVLPDIVKWLSFNNCVLRLAPAWRAIFVEGDPLLNASNLVEVELMSSC